VAASLLESFMRYLVCISCFIPWVLLVWRHGRTYNLVSELKWSVANPILLLVLQGYDTHYVIARTDTNADVFGTVSITFKGLPG